MVLADVRRPGGSARPPAGDADPRGDRSPRDAQRGPGRPAWGQTLLLAVAMSAALWGFHPLLQDVSWWLAGTAQIVLVLGVAAIVRTRTRSRWMPPVIGALAGALVLTPAFAPGTGLAVVVPTAESVEALRTIAMSGLDSIASQAIPATPEPGIVLLIVAALAGMAAVADILVLEAEIPAFAAAPLLGLLAVPIGVQEGIADPIVFLIVAALYLAMLRKGLRGMPLPAIAGVGAVALVGSLVVPAILPPVTPAEQPTTIGPGANANPFIELGRDLRRGANVTALTYSGPDEQQPYLRLATLSDFRGSVWAPDRVGPTAAPIDSVPEPQGLAGDVTRVEHRVNVRVTRVGGSWLPLPYPTTRVTGLNGQWRIDPAGLVGRAQNAGIDGQNYSADFLEVQPTSAQLRAAPPVQDPRFDRYLALPVGIPAVVQRTAEEVTADAGTDYDRAVALQDWFRSEFTYSEQTPVDDGYDGTGVNVLPEFLQQRSGYCVHFSSAMAVMARQLGIPSRVVVGYLPGTRNGAAADGDTRFEVGSNDLHAWPELYFSGAGWVRFEPTASRGDVPSYSDPTQDDSDPSSTPTPTESAAPSDGPSASASPSSSASAAPDAANSTGAVPPIALGTLGVLLGILVVLLIPAIARKVQRAWRFSRLRGGGGGPAAWAELRDTVRDLGLPAPPTETAGDLAERLARLLPDGATGSLDRLLDGVEREAYARRPGVGIDPDDLREVISALASTRSARERLRATLLPPSLTQRLSAIAGA